jgi:hypothetical protein
MKTRYEENEIGGNVSATRHGGYAPLAFLVFPLVGDPIPVCQYQTIGQTFQSGQEVNRQT